MLKDSVEHPGNLAKAQTKQRGGKLGFVYRHALKGYSAKLSPGAVKALRRNPHVKFIEPVRKAEVAAQTTPTGVSRIFAPENSALDIDETDDVRVDADIAIIDTGVDYEHPDLNVVARTDCTHDFETEYSVEECIDNSGIDEFGHGTHVAGIAAAIDNGEGVVGVAPGARIWSVRVLGPDGSGWTSWIVAGIDWVTAHASEIEVANMSLSGYGRSPAEEAAINASIEAGVVYAVAAGNDGLNALTNTPANIPDVITVSALADSDGEPGGEGKSCRGPDDTTATFSNWGSIVDIAAPGACIYSTLPLGESVYGEWFGKEYGSISGTSMASPHVAGAAAIKASESNPNSKSDVLDIRYELVVEESSRDWTDTADDGHAEPLLYVGGEALEDIEASTGGWESVSSTSVKVYAGISRAYYGTSYKFEYGLTDEYGQTTKSKTYYNNGPTPTDTLINLKPEATYHYRVAVWETGGWRHGADRIFATSRWAKDKRELVPVHTASEWLNDIDCTSAEFCASVGHYYHQEAKPPNSLITYVPYFLGGWGGVSAPVPAEGSFAELNGVSCTSSSACTAVGRVQTPSKEVVLMAERWNGSSWSLQSIASPASSAEEPYATLTGVSCATASDCIAVGYYKNSSETWVNYSTHWNGSSWSALSTPNPEPSIENVLEDVSCSSTSSCTAVGWYVPGEEEGLHKYMLRWNGSSWSSQTPANASGWPSGVDCVSASFCVSVGGWGGSAETWDGEEWTSEPASFPEGAVSGYLLDVSCISETSCGASGNYFIGPRTRSMTAVWDGTEWSSRSMPRDSESRDRLWGISCVAEAGCRTAGETAEEIGDGTIQSRPIWAPTATVQTPGNYKPGKVELRGAVEPNGVATKYHFEWGTKAEYEAEEYNNVIPSPDKSVDGVGSVSVKETIEGLKGETEYHYRVVAQSTEGSSVSADKSFTTPSWRPQAGPPEAIGVGRDEATLVGWVNPVGSSTDYRFEWGTQTEYEEGEYNNSAPVPDEDIGSGEKSIEVTHELEGLATHATYHVRIVAENAEGVTMSVDRAFTTATSAFEAGEEPVTIKGTPEDWFILRLRDIYTYCDAPSFEASATGPFEILVPEPMSHGECYGGIANELDMHDCRFEFDPGAKQTGYFAGEMNIGPPGCGPITVNMWYCSISIPPQVGRTVTLHEVGEGSEAAIRIDAEVDSLRYTQEGPSGYCAEEDKYDGGYTGSWEVKAENKWEEPVGMHIDPYYQVNPQLSSEGYSDLGATTVDLQGTIDTSGLETSYYFEYGLTDKYGSTSPGGKISEGATELSPVEVGLEGLEPETTYHYRLRAYSDHGSAMGPDRTFTTTNSDFHATQLSSSRFPTNLHAAGETPFELYLEESEVTLTCDDAASGASLTAGTDALALTVDECAVAGVGSAEVVANSCDFVLNVANSGPPYSGGPSIACAEEGDAIEFAVFGSVLSIGPQTPGDGSIAYENEGSGSTATVSAEGSAAEVAWSCSGEFICNYVIGGEEGSDGVLAVDASVAGEDEAEEAVGLYVEAASEVGVFATGEEGSEGDEPRIETSEYPVLITGSNDVAVEFEVGEVTLTCEAVALGGSLGGGTDALALAPEFDECAAPGIASATVEANSCDFVLNVANSGPPYSGGLSVACAEEGEAIEFAFFGSVLSVGPQTPGGGSLAYGNEGSGSAATLTAQGSATEVAWTCSGEFICNYVIGGEEGSDGVLAVDASLAGRYGE